MTSKTVRMVEGGKIVIPAALRREVGMNVGDTLIVETLDGELRIRSRRSAVLNAQRLMREFVSGERSLVDELAVERRADAERE